MRHSRVKLINQESQMGRRIRQPRMESTTLSLNTDARDGTNERDRKIMEVDPRVRDSIYEIPDMDNFDYKNFDGRKLSLSAPPPRTHEKHGKMRQHWVAFKHNNGRRVRELMDIGYNVRHPDTVPSSFKGLTEKWEMNDVIMVGGEHLLMEIPESRYIKLQRVKHEANNAIIKDIKNSHGKVTRVGDGEVQEFRDNTASRFYSATEVAKDDGDSINFDK